MLEVVGADDTLLTKTEEVTGGSADIDTGVVGVAKVVALELPAEGGELLAYGEPGLELTRRHFGSCFCAFVPFLLLPAFFSSLFKPSLQIDS